MQMMTLDELKKEAFKNSNVKKEYDALEEEFKLIKALVDMRQKAGLTQEEIAQKMSTQKSNISRLESGAGNPGWKTLQKYAHACGFKIQLKYSQ
ncbi:helix-turn-helix transcriptional regulator [Thiomicrospira sp. R3]|uniref:helix-turn-helix domain-containing protein n=1 Tax=Thiomicrospira sp. R3 TaxID=3035472 RepID=UPI00259B83EC|nr:helix-turn-helix transcriptional regulator [Thiomicrospira sp. R3]WFE67798.1 helix-turn-helix transcriptional regulator [Thiomicrospira sp. R3]